ncbi:hypothetical protein FNV43_RR16763 [Rhamnella rubrinervis]|uniref:Uncharacterized protein n=1 Tax=Rhamnella rubrinervis TaxID=2594499 RepID=A0A8K0GZG1_9ROSA|nr:hypothetical protein FNV43_RR16763 [Rhamnella rubrinervis]
MDTCLIPASQQEQYIDLEIPLQHIQDWLRDGYSYMHFGVIRIVLTAYARQGIPTAVKMVLLNSTFLKEYCLNILPNFNVSLKDPNLPNMLKIQIQMTGPEQVATAYAATLHHQVVYRLQNHALNLPGPNL